MQGAFVIVVIAVGVVGVLGALVSLFTGGRHWESLGRDHLLMESDLRDHRSARSFPPTATPPPGVAQAEREAEIRQMLEARNARRRRRGEPELDVEAELASLIAPPRATPTAGNGAPEVDAELRAEIRDLVIARNHRRANRNPPAPPLDVEAEIAREIGRLSG